MITDAQIKKVIPHLFKGIDILNLGEKHHGKVRDFYFKDSSLILITTDRQSAFDVNLGFVPYKGAVLNQLTQFWFEKTKDIVANHMISVPDPNVMVGKLCSPIPIEMVVRGYITGSTNTSIWYSYKQGERKIYGLDFPEGLKKNQKLVSPVITPTTKGSVSGHDERMTREEILASGVVQESVYKQMEEATYALFKRGNEIAEKAGLIMPDTKYEFGIFEGKLTLMDELHTPDGSRFWIKDTYEERFEKEEEPENFDKEFIRLWYTSRIDPYKDPIPDMPEDLMITASRRYIDVYEKLTGKEFKVFEYPIKERILTNLQKVGLI
jgi:phosphoribosylaminoimidazole-succinocarboxamide synthase